MNWIGKQIDAAVTAAHGRHTLFCTAFFIAGNVLHWFHRLDGTYVGFMATLMGFVLGHSVKEDYFKNGGGPGQ